MTFISWLLTKLSGEKQPFAHAYELGDPSGTWQKPLWIKERNRFEVLSVDGKRFAFSLDGMKWEELWPWQDRK